MPAASCLAIGGVGLGLVLGLRLRVMVMERWDGWGRGWRSGAWCLGVVSVFGCGAGIVMRWIFWQMGMEMGCFCKLPDAVTQTVFSITSARIYEKVRCNNDGSGSSFIVSAGWICVL